ncbi:MAG: redoxin domain-containing protein [Candidatus Eremiobacteraeota bacterium]|nr:redoxin domain-containing protein [Candidatus Eremiobacteraeota bacterium]
MKRLLGLVFGALLLGAAAVAPQNSYALLLRAHDWINGMPSSGMLANKVVLVDVFTFDCINCKHVVPELRRLSAMRSDALAIVGIHSPETPYERERSNLVENLHAQGITWPVAVDNDFTLWNAYAIQYWPTQLIFDRHGRLRATIVGEGRDAEIAATIEHLEREP